MNATLSGMALVIELLGRLLFALAVVVAVVALVDWLVRTRRINPFNPVARFFRRSVDPLLAPIERRVIAAGGLPASAPWWALAAVVVGGIVLLSALKFLFGQLHGIERAFQTGPAGIYALLVRLTFSLLRIALLVRIVASWVRISPWSKWVRWAFTLTEPILRPLRRIVPPLGMFDITPLVAYFLLYLVEGLLLGLVR